MVLYLPAVAALVLIALGVLAVAAGAYAGRRWKKKSRALWAPFRDLLDRPALEFNEPVEVSIAGATLIAEYTIEGYPKDPRDRFLLTREAPSPFRFRVTPQGPRERWLNKFGFDAEPQSGDPQFDDEYYLETDAPVRFIDYLSADRRAAIDELFKLGAIRLELGGRRLLAACEMPTAGGPENPEQLERTVRLLDELIRGLPPEEATPIHIHRETRAMAQSNVARRGLAVAAMVLAVAGINLATQHDKTYPPLDSTPLLLFTLAVSLVIVALLGRWALRLFRGTLGGARAIGTLLFLLTIGVPTTLFSSLIYCNGMLDAAPATQHEARVLGKFERQFFNSRPYHLKLSGWRPGHKTEIVDVSEAQYRTRKRTRVVVVVRPGALGVPWVESVTD